eukprot:5788319-Pyramimonas_sp.AAC.1
MPSVKGCSVAVNSFLAPHRPVGLRLAARAVPTTILVHAGPRKPPQEIPVGAYPVPPDWAD